MYISKVSLVGDENGKGDGEKKMPENIKDKRKTR